MKHVHHTVLIIGTGVAQFTQMHTFADYVHAVLLIKLLECDFWVNINDTCCVCVQSETDTRQPQVATPTFGVPIPEPGSSTKGFIQVVATM